MARRESFTKKLNSVEKRFGGEPETTPEEAVTTDAKSAEVIQFAGADGVEEESPQTLLADRFAAAEANKAERAQQKAAQRKPAAVKVSAVEVNGALTSINSGEQHIDEEVSNPTPKTVRSAVRKAFTKPESSGKPLPADVRAVMEKKWSDEIAGRRRTNEQMDRFSRALPRAMKAERKAYERKPKVFEEIGTAETVTLPESPKRRKTLSLERTFDPSPEEMQVKDLKAELHNLVQTHALAEKTPNSTKEFNAKLRALLEKYGPKEELETPTAPARGRRTPEAPQAVSVSSETAQKSEEELGREKLFADYQQAMKKALGEEEPKVEAPVEKKRIDAFLENARRVNDEVMRAKQEEPIVMNNSVLSRQAGLKDVAPPSFKEEESIVMLNPVLSRQAGLKKNLPKFVFSPETPAAGAPPVASARPAKAETARRALPTKKKLGIFGALGVTGLLAALGLTQANERTSVTVPIESSNSAMPKSNSSETIQYSTDAPPRVTVGSLDTQATVGPRGEQSARFEQQAQSPQQLFTQLRIGLLAKYPAGTKAQNGVVRLVLATQTPQQLDRLLSALNFTQGGEAAHTKAGDAFVIDAYGRLVFDSNGKQKILLVPTAQEPGYKVANVHAPQFKPAYTIRSQSITPGSVESASHEALTHEAFMRAPQVPGYDGSPAYKKMVTEYDWGFGKKGTWEATRTQGGQKITSTVEKEAAPKAPAREEKAPVRKGVQTLEEYVAENPG